MPGTLLSEDLQSSIEDQLRQHINNLVSSAQQAAGAAQQAVVQPVQAIGAGMVQAPQAIQTAVQPAQQTVQQVQDALNAHIDQLGQQAQQAQQNLQQGAVQVLGGAQQAAGQTQQQVQDALNAHIDTLGGAQPLGATPSNALGAPAGANTPTITALGGTSDAQSTPASAGAAGGGPAPDRSMPLQDYARAAAQRAGIDPNIFVAQIQQESGFTPTAKSPAGAIGIAQLMPATAAGMNVDPTDAYASLRAAAQLDAQNLKKYNGDYAKMLAAYNAGGGAVDQYGGVPPYKETQTYVNTILNNAKTSQTTAQARASDLGYDQPTDARVFPVVGYTDKVQDHWGSVKGGSDLMAPRGTPVVAMEGGKVLESGWNDVGGNSVLIQGKDGNQYYYAHFDKAPSVKVGDVVESGTFLGPVGNTGDAQGGPTHLHIGIGPDIKLGADKYGGTGGDFDAVSLLNQAQSGQQALASTKASTAAAGPAAVAPPTALGGGAAQQNPVINATTETAPKPIYLGQNQPASDQPQSQPQSLGDQIQSTIQKYVQDAVSQALNQAQNAGSAVVNQVEAIPSRLGEQTQRLRDEVGTAAQEAVTGASSAAGDAAQAGASALGGAASDLGSAIGPNLGFDDAELQRRRDRVSQNEQLIARSSTGAPGDQTPQSVLGGLEQTATGPAFGTVQSPEQIRQNVDEVSQNLKDNNPVRDVVLVGGLSNMVIDQVVQNPLLFMPGAPMGEALNTVGGMIVGDVAPQLGPVAARLGAAAINGGVQNAIFEMGHADATPVSVGTAFLQGAGVGAGLDIAPTAAAAVGRAVLRRVPDLADALAPAVSRFAREETGAAGRPEDVALQRAQQAVDDLKARFPQMSPGAVAASREGKALAALQAEAIPPGAGAAGEGPLARALTRLESYPENLAGPVRAWARTADASSDDVARTIEQWMAENPRTTAAGPVPFIPPDSARGSGASSTPAAARTVGGASPLSVGSAARSIELGATRGGPAPSGTTADRMDYLLGRGKYAPQPEGPSGFVAPTASFEPRATTVAGSEPTFIATAPSALDLPSRNLGPTPGGTTADRLDYLLGQGKYAPPGERPSPSGLQQLNLVRIAGLLANTTTQLVNATGNVINGASAIPDQVVASGIDWARVAARGGQRERYLGETLPMLQAWGPGFIAKLPEALQILKTGLSPEDMGRLERVAPGLNSYYTRVFGVPVGKLLTPRGGRAVDTTVEMPLRLLQAADTLFRGGAQNAYLHGGAIRKALQDGFTGQDAAQRASYILQHLEQFPELVQNAENKAARAVFQEQRTLPFVSGLQQSRAAQSDIGQFAESQILPFVKTPANITAQGAGRSPLGFAGAEAARRAGDMGEFADRTARAAIGSGVFGVAMWAGAHGMLTGDYPDDRSTLPQGWRPWSVRVPTSDGAVYVPFQNFGSYGWPLAMAAIATDAVHQGKPWADATQLPKMLGGIGSYVLDNTFLQGLSDFTDMLHDPQRFADRWAQGEAASFVPLSGLGRELNNVTGSTTRDPRQGIQGILDAMAATNPVTAGEAPERTNALGDAQRPGATGLGAAAAPLRYSVETDDPTLKVLRDNGVGISNIAKQINVPKGHVDLSDEEQAQFKQARGELIKRYVGSEMRSADFAKGSSVARNKYLSDAVQRANADARDQMLTQWVKDREGWRARIQPKAVSEPYYLGGEEAA